MEYKNLDQVDSYKELMESSPVDIKNELNAERVNKYEIKTGSQIRFNYAPLPVNDEILNLLQNLSEEQNLVEKYKLILNGETMNTGESRKVLHHLTRRDPISPVIFNGEDLRDFYIQQQERINNFAGKVHSGQIKGSTGKNLIRLYR